MISLICISLAGAGFAFDLTEIGVGARPLGMGKAFNAVADDGSAIFMNPAGLAGVERFNVLSMSGNLINEVPYMLLGGSWRTQYGVFGLGYVGASVGDIKETVLINGTPEVTGNKASYGNTTLLLSYGNDAKDVNYVNKIAFLTDRGTKVGANLKIVSYGFSGGASFEGGSGSGFDLDLGTIIPVNDNLTGSFSIKNIIPGNNLKNDELPMSLIGGVAYTIPDRNLLTAADMEIASYGGLLFHLGAEWNPTPPLFLRGGLDQKPDGFNLALGVGTKFRGFTFDYAYHTYAELAGFTTHYFSIGYIAEEMGKKPAVSPAPAPVVRPRPAAAPAPAAKPKSEMAKKIEAYIGHLESKLSAARAENDAARVEKLEKMIDEQKVRLEAELAK